MKRLCILGSTGSIGQNCLRVVRSLPGRFRVVSLAAGKNLDALAEQAVEFGPQIVSVGDPSLVEPLRERLRALEHRQPVEVTGGTPGQIAAATHSEVDFVVSASHGTTGLSATFEAVKAGKQLGLANKETLVVAGELVTRAARENQVEIIPIDSEHSALHQCLRSGRSEEVRRVLLTASGGPFLRTPKKDFDSITPAQALKHPVWKMGGRITIDSATLMNKGMEIIEAHWLFGFESSQIEVVIHPESVIHSMIEFIDGSTLGQLSLPDMRVPIQYALTYPSRVATDGNWMGLDLAAVGRLSFRKPDSQRFPCLRLARVALEKKGATPCFMNAADEIAVQAFLERRLRFSDIARVVEKVMEAAPAVEMSSLENVLGCDQEARARARETVAKLGA